LPVGLIGSLLACPVCFTDVGQQVRAEILGPDLLFNVGVAVLPFAFLAAAVAAVERLPFLDSARRPSRAPDAAAPTREKAPWTADR
jgi:hypothetical protein